MLMKARWFKKAVCSWFILFALLAASSASEGTVHVTEDGDGTKSGDSWENAMGVVEFRQALNMGTSGEYWVAKGTYTPTSDKADRDASFVLSDGIALYGGFEGVETEREQRNPAANLTTLTGDLKGDDGADFLNYDDNSYHVVYANGVEDTAILDGFTITGGNANGTNDTDKYGGGMYTYYSIIKLTNCTFSENTATSGGGMNTYYGIIKLTDCTFSENKSSQGGGMSIAYGSQTVTNCTFSGNKATGPMGCGGGMYI